MSRKWETRAGKLTIPYKIASSMPNSQRLFMAIRMWSESTKSKIRFVQFSSQSDYIYFVPRAKGCFVGKVRKSGGEQPISISEECEAGNIAHEIGHVLGLFHEQSRNDRDMFVSIDFRSSGGNAMQYKFAQSLDPSGRPIVIGIYDFNSIMHYPERSYFRVRPNYQGSLKDKIPGQQDSLNKGDIATIKYMYNLLYFNYPFNLLNNFCDSIWPGYLYKATIL